MRSVPIALLSLLAWAPVCWAQGTVTAGAATFTWIEFNVNVNNADYTIGAGPDHLFEDWWYFRIDGDVDETVLPAPDTQDYTGPVATLGWSDVAGRGLFDAQLVTTVFGGGGATSYVRHELTITNIGVSSLGFHLFGYLDLDLTNTSTEDQAALLIDPELMAVFDSTTSSEFEGAGASEFQVTDTQGGAASLRTLLSDGLVTDLDGSGLPFGPADFEGAYQWDANIPPSGSVTFTKRYSVDRSLPIFEDGFESGDTTRWSFSMCVGAPAIDIEKWTNGHDADFPPGPSIDVGDPVLWTYVVTNIGDVSLEDVAVSDDQEGSVSCPQATMEPGESMTCKGAGTAAPGQYANIGTATGTADSACQVEDTDPSHHFGSTPP